MELVKPGLNVRVVTDVDPTKEIINVRASSVYDVTGNTVIIAQTDPPAGPALINKSVMITYVKDTYVKDDAHKHVRYGFPAHLADVIDYNLASGKKVEALRVEREGDTRPYSIRMFHRVEPSAESGLRLFIGCREMKILDISLGGIRFCHDGTLKLGPERIKNILLDIGEKTYSLQARICRSWESPDIRSWKEGYFATAEFITISSNFERILVKKLHQIERNSRPEKDVL